MSLLQLFYVLIWGAMILYQNKLILLEYSNHFITDLSCNVFEMPKHRPKVLNTPTKVNGYS